MNKTFSFKQSGQEVLVSGDESKDDGPDIRLSGVSRTAAVGWCDLFYESEDHEGPHYTQFLFYDPECDEPLVKVIYFRDGRVRLAVNKDAVWMKDADNVGIFHKQDLIGFNPNEREK